RLGNVSLMVYLMFNEGWSTSGGETQIRLTLCEEAIRLSRLLVSLFPGMGEQVSLLSLLLFQHARRDARTDARGHLVPLENQDRATWDRSNIAEAQALLQKAQRTNHRGAYIIQAAIAAEHARASSSAKTRWPVIEAHYAALYALQPTPVVRLNQIAAQAKTRGAHYALRAMQSLEGDLAQYRWFHAMRGGLLQDVGNHGDAVDAFETALMLNPTGPERVSILEKIDRSKKELANL
ncbi:MAG: DUF6596 domain-containing protein, partial [Pseudomonadota bacterium]